LKKSKNGGLTALWLSALKSTCYVPWSVGVWVFLMELTFRHEIKARTVRQDTLEALEVLNDNVNYEPCVDPKGLVEIVLGWMQLCIEGVAPEHLLQPEVPMAQERFSIESRVCVYSQSAGNGVGACKFILL
jgi:hypothetical protein